MQTLTFLCACARYICYTFIALPLTVISHVIVQTCMCNLHTCTGGCKRTTAIVLGMAPSLLLLTSKVKSTLLPLGGSQDMLRRACEPLTIV